jgi:hypothetical protein
MPMYESDPRYSIACDEPGCYDSSPEESSEHEAERTALDPDQGWGKVGDKWYCPTHLGKAKRKGARGR